MAWPGGRIIGRLLGSAAVLAVSSITAPAGASPQQPTVINGQSSIIQSGQTTIIHQGTERSTINWQSFSLGTNEKIIFEQPNAAAISLDRVIGGGASVIAGDITANGQVILINPNGVLFTKSAEVNLSGLIATTSNIADSDFKAGKLDFSVAAPNAATVINQGTINVATGGYAVLSAAAVANTGIIRAKLGSVVLAGATEFTVDFDGDGLLQYAVTRGDTVSPHTQTLVEQSGTIAADGGQVLLTARAAQGVIQHVINMDGMTEANAVTRTSNGTLVVGAVTLDGGSNGSVQVTGSIQATSARGTGGTVEVLGENVSLTGSGNIQAWGNTGGGTVLFGGNVHGTGPQADAKTAYVGSQTTIAANATTKGNGGKVVVWSNNATGFAGFINVEGGAAGGNGGFVETSGKAYLQATGIVDAKARSGKPGQWLLDPTAVTINDEPSSTGTFDAKLGVFTPAGDQATINAAEILAALDAGTSVLITTASAGKGTDSITIDSPLQMIGVSSTTTAILQLTSSPLGSITVNAPIGVTTGNLTLIVEAGQLTFNTNFGPVAGTLVVDAITGTGVRSQPATRGTNNGVCVAGQSGCYSGSAGQQVAFSGTTFGTTAFTGSDFEFQFFTQCQIGAACTSNFMSLFAPRWVDAISQVAATALGALPSVLPSHRASVTLDAPSSAETPLSNAERLVLIPGLLTDLTQPARDEH